MSSNFIGSSARAIAQDFVNYFSLAGKGDQSTFTAGSGQVYASETSLFAQVKLRIAVKIIPIYLDRFMKGAGSFEKLSYFSNLKEKNPNLLTTIRADSRVRVFLKEVDEQQQTEQKELQNAVDNTKNLKARPYATMLKNMAILMGNLAKYGTAPAALDKFLKNTNNRASCETF